MSFNLFTYGTLLKGNPNDFYLSTSNYVGDGKLNGIKLFDYINSQTLQSLYPVALESENGSELLGEVYEVPDAMLPYLEKLEGTPTLYTRETREVTLADGSTVQCFVYIGNPSTWKNVDMLIDYPMEHKYVQYQYELAK